jgi:hypothetical protein
LWITSRKKKAFVLWPWLFIFLAAQVAPERQCLTAAFSYGMSAFMSQLRLALARLGLAPLARPKAETAYTASPKDNMWSE